MKELSISLIFNEKFKEIYYANGNGNVFTYKPTQKAILYCLLTATVTIFIYFVSFTNPGVSWLIFLGALIFLPMGINAIVLINKYLKWKNSVEASLKEIAKYKSHQLKLTSTALELTQDSTITIEKWENIKSAQILETYITLSTSQGPAFIFPASSMNSQEFINLKDFIVTTMSIPIKQ